MTTEDQSLLHQLALLSTGEVMFIDRKLENGLIVTITRMTFGNMRISLGDGFYVHSNYCYQAPKRAEAMKAFLAWDGEDDPPEGWYRHIETGRRRPDYTKASEEIRE